MARPFHGVRGRLGRACRQPRHSRSARSRAPARLGARVRMPRTLARRGARRRRLLPGRVPDDGRVRGRMAHAPVAARGARPRRAGYGAARLAGGVGGLAPQVGRVAAGRGRRGRLHARLPAPAQAPGDDAMGAALRVCRGADPPSMGSAPRPTAIGLLGHAVEPRRGAAPARRGIHPMPRTPVDGNSWRDRGSHAGASGPFQPPRAGPRRGLCGVRHWRPDALALRPIVARVDGRRSAPAPRRRVRTAGGARDCRRRGERGRGHVTGRRAGTCGCAATGPAPRPRVPHRALRAD